MSVMGRPPIQIDKEEFEKLCGLLCTLNDIAGWFDCSPDTIERWCQSTYNTTFADIHRKRASVGRVSLRRKQYEVAMTGDRTLLIWLGKQHLDQSEKLEHKADIRNVTGVDEEKLRELIEAKECRLALLPK